VDFAVQIEILGELKQRENGKCLVFHFKAVPLKKQCWWFAMPSSVLNSHAVFSLWWLFQASKHEFVHVKRQEQQL
jgi:hypothetical protein